MSNGKENIALLLSCSTTYEEGSITFTSEIRSNCPQIEELIKYSTENMDELMKSKEYKKWKIKKVLKK